MTDSRDAAAIIARYTQARPYPSLGVVRIVCEVPIEHEAEVHKRIGYAGKEGKPVAVVLVDPEKVKAYGQSIADNPEPPKRKKREPDGLFNELPLVKQAGILCTDAEFQKWIRRGWRNHTKAMSGEEAAAHIVHVVCGVESRTELDRNRRAGELWKEVVADFRDWQKTDARYKDTPAYEKSKHGATS